MTSTNTRFKTQYHAKCVNSTDATNMYNHLRDTISWEEGIKSKGKHSRFAKSLSFNDNKSIQDMLINVLKSLSLKNYVIFGLYLNYYMSGDDFTPNHKHKGTIQLIISLNEHGGDRKLTIGSKEYNLQNGDVILFGGSVHGIPKADNKNGRISIAVFMKEFPELNGSIGFGVSE